MRSDEPDEIDGFPRGTMGYQARLLERRLAALKAEILEGLDRSVPLLVVLLGGLLVALVLVVGR